MSDKDHRKVASHVLHTANKVVTTERGNQHGGAEDSFAMIGRLWEVYLGNTNQQIGGLGNIIITAYDVAQMMTLLKIARAVHGSMTNEDNYVDASGYQGLAAAIAGVQVPEFQPTNGIPKPTPTHPLSTPVMDAASTRAIAEAFAPKPEGK